MLSVVDHGEALLYNNNCTISTLSSYIAWYNGDLPIKSMALISWSYFKIIFTISIEFFLQAQWSPVINV